MARIQPSSPTSVARSMGASTPPAVSADAGGRQAGKGRRRRMRGEGSVYEVDGGKRWRGAIAWVDATGALHRRTVSAPTAGEARTKLDELRADLGLGILTTGKPETVGQYLAQWIERHRSAVRPATWHSREQHVRLYLRPALGRHPLRSLTAAQVESAMAAFLERGRPGGTGKPTSPTNVQHVRSTLRRALADAVRDRRVPRNAAADARPVYVAPHPIVYLAQRDVRRLLAATRDDPFGPLYALAVTTGLRQGELLGLTWADVDDGRLHVRRSYAKAMVRGWEFAAPKSARSRRTIPLAAAAREALETQRTRQRFARQAAGDDWQDTMGLVFTDALGRPVRPDHVSYRFRRACKAAGVPLVPFHALRHTAATLMLAQGVPLAVISEWLGHSGLAVTAMFYAAIVPELHQDAADAMDRAIGGEE